MTPWRCLSPIALILDDREGKKPALILKLNSKIRGAQFDDTAPILPISQDPEHRVMPL